MAIPGREINSELESCPVGRLGYRFYDISFSIAPGTAGYIMFGIFTGPQAKAIVMLGRQDHQLNPCILQHPHPLIRIKISGIKQRRRSEEHTSELQSRFDLVCRLLLEKKKRENSDSHNSS